jgi:hypothetical protein
MRRKFVVAMLMHETNTFRDGVMPALHGANIRGPLYPFDRDMVLGRNEEAAE